MVEQVVERALHFTREREGGAERDILEGGIVNGMSVGPVEHAAEKKASEIRGWSQ